MVTTRAMAKVDQMVRERVRRLYTLLIWHDVLRPGLVGFCHYQETIPVKRSSLPRHLRRVPRPRFVPRSIEFCELTDGVLDRTKVVLIACVHPLGSDCDVCSADSTLKCKLVENKNRRVAHLCCEIWNRDAWVNLSRD